MPDPMTLDDVHQMAEACVTAQVISLGDSPRALSGALMSCQHVTAEVTEVRSGAGLQVGDQVEFAIPLVGTASDVVPLGDGGYGLDATLYRQGQPFVTWVKRMNDWWTALDVEIERMS